MARARGDATSDSDYDIVALVDQPDSQTLHLQQRACLSLLGLGVAVDVLVMNLGFFERRRASVASLPATIEREGMVVYAA
ncbi:MAG TPA: nucleotidyltransferase domain-containing protein [Chloroflexota bacterium]|nr:nucleotidyltransferase domain-containing protein [Chloroflexota bacterium]